MLFAALGLVSVALVAAGAAAASPAPRPHIVFLLTDDLGYNAPGYRNADLQTPALDELAAEGAHGCGRAARCCHSAVHLEANGSVICRHSYYYGSSDMQEA